MILYTQVGEGVHDTKVASCEVGTFRPTQQRTGSGKVKQNYGCAIIGYSRTKDTLVCGVAVDGACGGSDC